ncbi:MAG: PBSX family phage terminase large subunit [Gammaproteobacteria bacterium]|nr:MAG: PBSX family phage terminase large subunit [Gammaproteobacteria bacterium]
MGTYRYRVLYGGRGSAKSWSIARTLILLASQSPLRILCGREYQSSVRDSVHRLLSDQISAMGLGGAWDVQRSTIVHGTNGSEFIFKGLRHNPQEIKSTEAVDVAWIEEAEAVSAESWRVLIPTIRKPGSEIWVSFNPAQETDPTYQRFVVQDPHRALVIKMGYRDNPWLPAVLREEAEEAKRRDPEAYAHVWGGEPWTRSDAQVLVDKWVVEDFTPAKTWDGPYFGADWGFSQDPTVLVRFWLADGCLWIEYEAGGVGVELQNLGDLFRQVPGAEDYRIRSDGSRPETIRYMQTEANLDVIAAPKWAGSVEEGVTWLRSHDRIVIHPRCRRASEEARLWSYKTDRQTGDPLPVLKPGYDHVWDAVRYGAAPMIRKTPEPGLRAL